MADQSQEPGIPHLSQSQVCVCGALLRNFQITAREGSEKAAEQEPGFMMPEHATISEIHDGTSLLRPSELGNIVLVVSMTSSKHGNPFPLLHLGRVIALTFHI